MVVVVAQASRRSKPQAALSWEGPSEVRNAVAEDPVIEILKSLGMFIPMPLQPGGFLAYDRLVNSVVFFWRD